ncbi:hypothetical protein [Niveibacterium sp. SC-1]|uniref:hypothetical protein n=1 Tax=Niveibacterium sp. SC-1 TaxID=3135646 RepID=UPI00311E1B13
MNRGLVMMDVAASSRQSVMAGLRGEDDGRVGLYERYMADTTIGTPGETLEEVGWAYTETLYAGCVPGTHIGKRSIPLPNAPAQAERRVSPGRLVERVLTQGLFAVTTLGMVWWLTH